jgi:hypothetical protein
MTYEQLLKAARPLAARRQLGRIEVGKAALDRLMGMAGPDASEDERTAIWGAVTPGGGGLLGVPLVLPTGDDALDPDAWRLLDTDGHIIKEGTL